MVNSFPPISTRKGEIEGIIAFLEGIAPDHNAVYFSAPITSGRRYLEWRAKQQKESMSPVDSQDTDIVGEVVAENREHARSVMSALRRRFPQRIVIDPTSVPDVINWRQSDYRYAWGRVIERFVTLVVFATDWQLSSGCSYEFLVAQRARIETVDECLSKITIEAGSRLIQESMAMLEHHRLDAGFHDSVVKELWKISNGRSLR
jgi:hypothetical protein